MKYKHIFFDLDHTLWDFEKNALETLSELYEHFKLSEHGVPSLELFVETYLHRNDLMWEQYRFGNIDKDTLRNKRFEFALYDLEVEDSRLAKTLSDEYIKIGPKKTNVFPQTHETLDYLKEKYTLHIISNGFPETQSIKMDSSDISKYFSKVILSENVGFKKPHPNIFLHALNKAKTNAAESLMIGDNLDLDIEGARMAAIDQVYFNPKKIIHSYQPTYEIEALIQLKDFL